MHRHLLYLIAAAGFAALASVAPASAGYKDCACGPVDEVAVEAAPIVFFDSTPRYLVNPGPLYTGPGLLAPPPVFTDSPSARGKFPYVRSYYGWYFVGARRSPY